MRKHKALLKEKEERTMTLDMASGTAHVKGKGVTRVFSTMDERREVIGDRRLASGLPNKGNFQRIDTVYENARAG